MSIPHDDDNKCTRYHNEKKKLHVMARMLDYNSNPWSWSDCSREYLTTFFEYVHVKLIKIITMHEKYFSTFNKIIN